MTFHQTFCKIIFNFQVNIKSIPDTDENFSINSYVMLLTVAMLTLSLKRATAAARIPVELAANPAPPTNLVTKQRATYAAPLGHHFVTLHGKKEAMNE